MVPWFEALPQTNRRVSLVLITCLPLDTKQLGPTLTWGPKGEVHMLHVDLK